MPRMNQLILAEIKATAVGFGADATLIPGSNNDALEMLFWMQQIAIYAPLLGAGGGVTSLAQLLALGASTGGTDLVITAGDDLNFGGNTTQAIAFLDGAGNLAFDGAEFSYDATTNQVTMAGQLDAASLIVQSGTTPTLVAGAGIFWVDGIVPMFKDSAGTDYVLNGASDHTLSEFAGLTVYVADEPVTAGELVIKRIAAGTSTTTLNAGEAANWALVSQSGPNAWAATTTYFAGQEVIESQNVYSRNATGDSAATFTVGDWTLQYALGGVATVEDWAATTAYTANMIVKEGDRILRRGSDGTSGATFDLTEAGDWTMVSQVGVADWTAATVYMANEIVRAEGQHWRNQTTRLSGASLDASETTSLEQDPQRPHVLDWVADTRYHLGALAMEGGRLLRRNLQGISSSAFNTVEDGRWDAIAETSVDAWVASTATPLGHVASVNGVHYIHNSGRSTGAQFDATEAAFWSALPQTGHRPDWAATTWYNLNAVVMTGGVELRRIADGYAGATFDATEAALWEYVSGDVNTWTALTLYVAGQRVVNGTDVYSRNVSGFSAATFTGGDWTLEYAIGGSSSVDTGKTTWVDAANGHDVTGEVYRFDLPYLTVSAALATASSGDTIRVRTGTYTESGLVVPAGVACVGDGLLNTIVGDASATTDIFTLSSGSLLQGFRVTLPAPGSDSPIYAGVKHSVGTSTLYDLDLRGDLGTGKGTGIYKTGAGKIVGGNVRCEGGGLAALLRVDSGVLALDDVHVPGSTGTIDDVVLVQGSGRFQGQGVNVGNANVVDCLHVEGTGTAIVYSPNWSAAAFGGHIAADGVEVVIIGGKIDASTATLLVDAALTGVDTKLTVSGTTIQPTFSFPVAALTNMELSAQFHQEQTSTRDSEARVVGADFVTGFPELGSGASIGEGSAYSDGQVVITTDGTSSPTSNGAGLTDESALAGSRDSSTFTFQGLTAGHAIMWCTDRVDASADPLKHWGLLVNQTDAGVGGSYVWEIQTAADTWVEVRVMAVSSAEQYRYANSVFLRASSSEVIRLGIDPDTTWTPTTINGTLGRWMRVRVATTVTTAPTFERWRLSPARWVINGQGQVSAFGPAEYRLTLFSASNMWGEGGGANDFNETVGSGSSSAGETWSNKNKKGRINNSSDFLNFNFTIPGGLDTSQPLKFRLLMSSVGAGDVDMRMSVLPVAVLNNLIADSGGGIVPVARTSADPYNVNPAQVVDLTTFSTVTDTMQAVTFGGFDISDYYEDDMLALRIGFDPGGSSRDVDVWALSIEGVSFTAGKIL